MRDHPVRLRSEIRRAWATLCLAVKIFLRIDGTQLAAAFAFNLFFSVFPLIVLIVTIASFFVDRDTAGKEVIAGMKSYLPISSEMQGQIFDSVAGVIKARGQAGVIAFPILIWGALQCFTTLICAANRAWGTAAYNWWRLPLKSLVLLGITSGAVLLGLALPVLVRFAGGWVSTTHDFRSWASGMAGVFVPSLAVFFALSLFYRLAPCRPTRFAEVWAPALCATVLLRASESLFVIYLKNFATLNAVYGTLGGIMALLLWIYLSGTVCIFGACLCAGRTATPVQPANR